MLPKIYPCVLLVRMTEKEKKQVVKNAKKAGKSLSRYLVEGGV